MDNKTMANVIKVLKNQEILKNQKAEDEEYVIDDEEVDMKRILKKLNQRFNQT